MLPGFLATRSISRRFCTQTCSAAAYTSLAPQQYYTDADMKRPMYAGQSKLPKLPVPKLEDTVARYLRSIQPLASEAEFEETKVRRHKMTGAAASGLTCNAHRKRPPTLFATAASATSCRSAFWRARKASR